MGTERRILNDAFHETLIDLDKATHTMRYSIDNGPSPGSSADVEGYIGHVHLRPITKDNVQFPADLPLGELVGDSTQAKPPERKFYEDRYVNLAPVDPEKDIAELYRNFHGSQEKYKLWTVISLQSRAI
ncbi:MAG: hypothetical protein KJP23_24485 [Deltaproteobacteria bacterium]|nr:hypothetical protein [Deltaproteobacteria bacterium]